jgi:hypothetical protein
MPHSKQVAAVRRFRCATFGSREKLRLPAAEARATDRPSHQEVR